MQLHSPAAYILRPVNFEVPVILPTFRCRTAGFDLVKCFFLRGVYLIIPSLLPMLFLLQIMQIAAHEIATAAVLATIAIVIFSIYN